MSERNRVLEQQVVDYIAEHTRIHGYPPSTRDIGAHVERSKSHVGAVVRRLVDEGILEVNPRIRSVRIARAAMKARDEFL